MSARDEEHEEVDPMSERVRLQRTKRAHTVRSQTPRSELTAREVDQGVGLSINRALQSDGRPLDVPTRAQMQARFGHDFSEVRVHTDARAGESAQALDALAYTVGPDIVFGSGQYAPETTEGQRLLAHELTHVVQQGAAPAADAITPSGVSNAGKTAAVQRQVHVGDSLPARVQRQDEADAGAPVSTDGGSSTTDSSLDGGMTRNPMLPSTEWSLSGGFSAGGGVIGGGQALAMNLKNLRTEYSYLLTFVGVGLTAGFKAGIALSMPSTTEFTTSRPLHVEDFSCFGSLKIVELNPGIGGSLAYVSFWGVPSNPDYIDIGGLEAGVSAGGGVFAGRFSVWTSTATLS
jgi:hypothetical protein